MGKYFPLKYPPGIFRNGTKYQSKGRWYDCNLVRWNEGVMQPVQKWDYLYEIDDTVFDISEPIRGTLGWRGNDAVSRMAVGTATKAYAFVQGTTYDITPAGFTTGNAYGTLSGGAYGASDYGEGDYGVGSGTYIEDTAEAATWQFDSWGDYLIACAYSDGKIYYWDKVTTNNLAVVTAGAPTTCVGVVVTPERFVVALGADGDSRKIAWCDQGDYTVWTAATTNQAGDFIISSKGGIMCGRRSRNETLIWTSTDLWSMRYIGGTLVYSIPQIGENCGIVSRQACAMVDGRAYWMGLRGFFMYDGFVKPVPCDVSDYIFNDMNPVSASQIACMARHDYKEIWWFYASGSSTENDRYVIYNYVEGHWSIGALERTSGFDRGAFQYPMWADGQGKVWRMGAGDSYIDVDDSTTLVPWAEAGPVEVEIGNRVYDLVNVIPDEKTQGDVTIYFYTAYYPNQTETLHGPYTPANPTNVRLNGRQIRLRVYHNSGDWRVGTMRFEVEPGGRR